MIVNIIYIIINLIITIYMLMKNEEVAKLEKIIKHKDREITYLKMIVNNKNKKIYELEKTS
jgi:hypothetical protein